MMSFEQAQLAVITPLTLEAEAYLIDEHGHSGAGQAIHQALLQDAYCVLTGTAEVIVALREQAKADAHEDAHDAYQMAMAIQEPSSPYLDELELDSLKMDMELARWASSDIPF